MLEPEKLINNPLSHHAEKLRDESIVGSFDESFVEVSFKVCWRLGLERVLPSSMVLSIRNAENDISTWDLRHMEWLLVALVMHPPSVETISKCHGWPSSRSHPLGCVFAIVLMQTPEGIGSSSNAADL